MDICKETHGEPCIRCMPGSCVNRKTLSVPTAHVKTPNKSVGRLTVDVNVNGIDEAIKKAEELKNMYADIDILQRRIIAGAERVEQIAESCKNAYLRELQDHIQENCIEKKI